jgi:hypothetical protein
LNSWRKRRRNRRRRRRRRRWRNSGKCGKDRYV